MVDSIAPSGGFAGRHVVVTGGVGALGGALVDRLVAQGATCHVPSLDARPERPGVHITAGVDLSDEAAVVAFYQGLPALWASVHVAGGFGMSPLEGTSLAELDRMLSMNLRTAFLCTREAARRMTAGGRIVNVAARPALDPTAGAGMVAYTVSKAGVAALTQASARELAPRGIWVNAVAPSIMDTPQNRQAMPTADHAAWPKTDEVAQAIAWLASPDNAVTSGAVVPVYGRTWP